MKYKIFFLSIFLVSCSQNYTSLGVKETFSAKGFAYIYSEKDYEQGIIKRKLDPTLPQVAHSKIRQGGLIKVINTKTNQSIVLKNNKKFEFSDFYKIIITKPVADKLSLSKDLPLVEIIEVKKNKSFVAKKTKIFTEEKKISSKAPVESVKISNISKNNNTSSKNINEKFNIIIAEFYSKKSANLLKKRISQELASYNTKKLYINARKSNKITLLSGPYDSIEKMKKDYILLKNFGFEELDISLND